MSHADFRPCTLRYGGNLVRGYETTCGRCGTRGQVHVNMIRSYGNDNERTAREITKKLEQDGWKVGERIRDDRCPACVRLDENERKAKLKVVPKEKPMTNAIAEAPRAASREEKRIILAKLDDVYDTNRQRYSQSWTDHKVATDLGVPRAWVSDLRDQLYGPEGNPEITSMLAEAKAYLEEAKPIFQKINDIKAQLGSLIAEAQKLTTRGEMIERKLTNIEKDLR